MVFYRFVILLYFRIAYLTEKELSLSRSLFNCVDCPGCENNRDFFMSSLQLLNKIVNIVLTQYDLSGYTTTEIIYEIFQRTIFSGEPERRR